MASQYSNVTVPYSTVHFITAHYSREPGPVPVTVAVPVRVVLVQYRTEVAKSNCSYTSTVVFEYLQLLPVVGTYSTAVYTAVGTVL